MDCTLFTYCGISALVAFSIFLLASSSQLPETEPKCLKTSEGRDVITPLIDQTTLFAGRP
jgi:hypothetical protein